MMSSSENLCLKPNTPSVNKYTCICHHIYVQGCEGFPNPIVINIFRIPLYYSTQIGHMSRMENTSTGKGNFVNKCVTYGCAATS